MDVYNFVAKEMEMLERVGEIRGQKLYRYVNSYGHIALREYPVLRETRGGKWVMDILGSTEHWVSNYSKKRLAYPTKEEALINFIKRTERHIMLAEDNLEHSKKALDRARVKERGNEVESDLT